MSTAGHDVFPCHCCLESCTKLYYTDDVQFNCIFLFQPLLVPGDLTDEETVRNTVDQTLAHFGRLDVLVNSAGILAMGGIETADLAQYDKVMDVNVRWVNF